MNPKGHVKLELYNEAGEVTFTKEKRNLVVLDANKIVANMMAQPSRKTRIADKVVGDTGFNGEGASTLVMPKHREEVVTETIDLGSSNVTEVALENAPYVTKIISASIEQQLASVGKQVFIKDGPKGIIGFEGAGKTGSLVIKYTKIVNDMVDIVRGSEKVVISGMTWNRSIVASDSETSYTVDYATGEIIFENPKTGVTITYEYETQYGLGFMGVGGLPTKHPEGQPVTFSRNDKYRTKLDNEYIGARQPINFPLTIEEGKPEIDVILAKDISSVERVLQSIEVIENDGTVNIDYLVNTSTTDGKRPLLAITRAIIKSGTLADRDLLANREIKITNAETGGIQLDASLLPLGLANGDRVELDYKLKAGDDHLIYQLNYSPVVELKAVRFENNLGAVTTIPVDASTKGMDFGTVGKVRVLNANAGTIEFSPEFEEKLKENPGKITVEYFVNSGTVVKFIADFPKGVPGPMELKNLEFIPDTTKGLTEYTAPHVLRKINEVLLNGSPISEYAVNGQKFTITNPSFKAGDTLVVKYDTESSTHTIYTVAMFDQMDESLSKMFNLSGIGPVTKDKNTGMRITWSVTF